MHTWGTAVCVLHQQQVLWLVTGNHRHHHHTVKSQDCICSTIARGWRICNFHHPRKTGGNQFNRGDTWLPSLPHHCQSTTHPSYHFVLLVKTPKYNLALRPRKFKNLIIPHCLRILRTHWQSRKQTGNKEIADNSESAYTEKQQNCKEIRRYPCSYAHHINQPHDDLKVKGIQVFWSNNNILSNSQGTTASIQSSLQGHCGQQLWGQRTCLL